MNTKTIAFVHHSLELGGGSEHTVYRIMRGLQDTEFRPVLCCMYEPGGLGERFAALGGATHSRIMSSRSDLTGFRRLARILEEEKAEVMWTTDGFGNMIVGRVGAALARTQVKVLSFHSYGTEIRGGASRARRLLLSVSDRTFHPGFDHYVALAESHRDYLVGARGLDPDKIAVVPNGIDLAEFEDARARGGDLRPTLGVEADTPLVTVVAGLEPWKSVDLFLEAAARLSSRHPSAHFLVVGDGSERAALEALATHLCIDDRTHFLGLSDDVPALLVQSTVLVVSSETEALPTVVMEAMAAHIPVVATDVGSISDLVEDDVTGCLVPAGSPDALARGIDRILSDPGLGQAMGEAGHRRAASRFDLKLMTDRYLCLLKEWTS